LLDAGFSPSDGRVTVQMNNNIDGRLTKFTNDELGQVYLRNDGYGRKLESDDKNGTRVNLSYDETAKTVESIYTANSDDPLFPESHTFTLKSQYNDAGILQSQTDDHGVTTNFESDSSGKLEKIINAENAELKLRYDSNDNVEDIEIPSIAVSGQHTTAEMIRLEEGIKKYNAAMKSNYKCHFDSLDRLDFAEDAAGNKTEYIYSDNVLKEIVYPGINGKETFTYYDSGRLETHTDQGGQTTAYHYEKGRISRIVNGQEETTYRYDDNGDLVEYFDTNDSANNVLFEYDSHGKIVKETHKENGQPKTVEYKYNGTGRLSQTINSSNDYLKYLYDNRTGNLKEVEDQNGSLVKYSYFGSAVKQETTHGLNSVYGFLDGQVSTNTITSASGAVIISYAFDDLNRLIGKSENMNGEITTRNFVYDTAGNVLKEELILPNSPPLVTRYYYDADGVLLGDERDEYNIATREMTTIVTERERDELGLITGFKEISRNTVHSGGGPIVSP